MKLLLLNLTKKYNMQDVAIILTPGLQQEMNCYLLKLKEKKDLFPSCSKRKSSTQQQERCKVICSSYHSIF
jgi:hypothetical protein